MYTKIADIHIFTLKEISIMHIVMVLGQITVLSMISVMTCCINNFLVGYIEGIEIKSYNKFFSIREVSKKLFYGKEESLHKLVPPHQWVNYSCLVTIMDPSLLPIKRPLFWAVLWRRKRPLFIHQEFAIFLVELHEFRHHVGDKKKVQLQNLLDRLEF